MRKQKKEIKMKKEKTKINGDDVTIIWGDWEISGDYGEQRFIERIIINGTEIELQELESAGQYRSPIQDVYEDGEQLPQWKSPEEVVYENAIRRLKRK
jgi:hypothetical protein